MAKSMAEMAKEPDGIYNKVLCADGRIGYLSIYKITKILDSHSQLGIDNRNKNYIS